MAGASSLIVELAIEAAALTLRWDRMLKVSMTKSISEKFLKTVEKLERNTVDY